MLRESILNDKRMESCPRYNRCEAPKCPLDELIDIRVAYPEDKKCRATKEERFLLGGDLPLNGLTKAEYAAIIRSYKSIHNYFMANYTISGVKIAKKNDGGGSGA
jgi:hypothetical protein